MDHASPGRSARPLAGSYLLLPALLLLASATDAQETCQRVNVGGRQINACVSGTGPATIVLAGGAGQSSATWTRLLPVLTPCARVITFDRPGFGGSEPGPPPRTPARIADELRGLLTALGVTEPVVLVGHSMGGIHALRYATRYPRSVSAVALLDTPPPGFEEARMALLTPSEQAERRRQLEQGLTNAPAAVRHEREGAADPAEWEFPGYPRTVPLLVIAADAQDFGSLGSASAHRALWIERSRAWLRLSAQSEFIVAEGSGHMVHHDRPDLVVAAVRRLPGAAPSSCDRSRTP